MLQIIVSHIGQAENAQFAAPGHEWIVEGDFGFLASYATRAEAYAHARVEVAEAARLGGLAVEIQGNE